MLKLIFAILVTVAVVTFSLSNSHDVELSLIFGPPVKIRLIFLLLCTFFLGMTVPIFHGIVRRIGDNRRAKREKKLEDAIQRVDQDLVG